MNYIHKLQDERKELIQDKMSARNVLVELEVYLCSEKFHQDSTVSVWDVLNRIADAKRILTVTIDQELDCRS